MSEDELWKLTKEVADLKNALICECDQKFALEHLVWDHEQLIKKLRQELAKEREGRILLKYAILGLRHRIRHEGGILDSPELTYALASAFVDEPSIPINMDESE